jgi:hypothetical protein
VANLRLGVIALAGVAAGVWLTASHVMAQQAQGPLPHLPEPFGDANEAIYPSFEGWGDAADGSGRYLVLGYKSRNRKQVVEVPVGPNNRIEPGGPDFGQPTVFYPGRQKTVFAIKVPKDAGDRKFTWTIVANGHTTTTTFYVNPNYNMLLYREDANGNEPPRMRFGPNEPWVSGPTVGFGQSLTGTVGQPVELRLSTSDAPPTEENWESILSARGRQASAPAPAQLAIVDGRVLGGGNPRARPANESSQPDITVVWTKMRGPGVVTVTPERVPLITRGDRNAVVEAVAKATFSAPGEYVLRAEPIEADDGYDGLCCFTFGNVKVTIK